jgi:transposase
MPCPPRPTSPPANLRSAAARSSQARDAELGLLKLMVEKLKLQLARRNRATSPAPATLRGPGKAALLEAQPLDEVRRQARGCQARGQRTAHRSKSAQRTCRARARAPPERQRRVPSRCRAGPPCGCSACGGRLRQIGQDVSEQLEYVPARFKVIRHVRPKLACVNCEAIFQAQRTEPAHCRGLPGRRCWRT